MKFWQNFVQCLIILDKNLRILSRTTKVVKVQYKLQSPANDHLSEREVATFAHFTYDKLKYLNAKLNRPCSRNYSLHPIASGHL